MKSIQEANQKKSIFHFARAAKVTDNAPRSCPQNGVTSYATFVCWPGFAYRAVLLLALAFVLFYEAINGFHDTANAVATVIYTRAMRSQLAVVMAAVLQISSYWQPGEFVSINLLPDVDLETFLNEQRNAHPNQSLKNTLAVHLPKRLVERLQQLGQIPDVSLKQLNVRDQQALISTLTDWRVQPNGTEGYRTAEVTLGGVDTNELSSRTMEARKVPGLYFIGEVMDVTGWLGGYNFQWAWSSAWACAQDLIAAKSS